MCEEYNDENELINYVWQYYSHLRTALEQRGAKAVFWLGKAENTGDLTMKKALTLFSSADDPEIRPLLIDGSREFVRRVVIRLLKDHGAEIVVNRCPECFCVLRTPTAKQCLWCNQSWHEQPVSGLVSGFAVKDIDEVLAAYERGLITMLERRNWLADLFVVWLNSGRTIEGFKNRVPIEDHDWIVDRFTKAPRSDDEWAAHKVLRVQSYCSPARTGEQRRQEELDREEWKQAYRRAVEIFGALKGGVFDR